MHHARIGLSVVGELSSLQTHLDSDKGCGYVEVGAKMKRKELKAHLERKCPLRKIQSQYCHYEDTYHTAKTEVCISYLGYAPCKSRGMNFIPLHLQGAYPRYDIHTSVFAVQAITSKHYDECPHYPLPCPNNCGTTGV